MHYFFFYISRSWQNLKNFFGHVFFIFALNPWLFYVLLFFINIFCSLFSLCFNFAFASDSDSSNAVLECKDFIRTSEDFSRMLNSKTITNDNPACKEFVEIFEQFKTKITPSHEPAWFFDSYKDSPWFRLWGESILHKPYFYDIVLKDAAFRVYFLDIMSPDIRSELFFWTNFNVYVKNFWYSSEFNDFLSNYSTEEIKSLIDYRSEKILEYQKASDFLDYLQKVDNFKNYIGSFPLELHAQMWAFEQLNEFERLCSKDAIFFSILPRLI